MKHFNHIVLLALNWLQIWCICYDLDVETSFISEYCNQTKKTLTCNGKGQMSSIPKIPRGIETLEIMNGNFSTVTRDSFINLKGTKVKTMKMVKCRIMSVSKDAFKYLTNIKTLDLSQNYGLKASTIAKSLHGIDNIRTILFNLMGWPDLPTDMFKGLETSKITHIFLNHNFMRHINGSVFKNLKSLTHLDLEWNGISDLNNTFEGLSHIKSLNLTGNWFSNFPYFCNENNQSYVPSLRHLRLDYSKINSLSTPIRCLDNLTSLDISGLSLRLLYNNTYSQLKSLTTLVMLQLGSQLDKISAAAFNSSSLRNLSLSVTGDFSFNGHYAARFHPKYLFTYCPNLEYLDLSHNRFQLSNKNWISLFKPLENLKSLILKDVKMQVMPILNKKVLSKLEYLDLSSNKISKWPGSKPFAHMQSLKVLKLRGNQISVINETSFPQSWINGEGPLRTLLLVGNPFSCSCNLIWLREWIDTLEARNISSDKDIWRCSMSNSKVIDYHPKRSFQCLVPYIVSSLVGLVAVLAVTFVSYICRFRIKLAIYRCRTRKRDYHKIVDRVFMYDVFVAYSYEDLQWIQNYLIPKMEDQNGRRLCIRDRDFQLGTVFSSHIIENIESSRTVLLVLSENFAKDAWCNFQLDVAVHMNVTQGRPEIIPVMLQNISFKYMKEPIYKIISTMDNCVWSEGGAEEGRFWTKIIQSIPIIQGEEGTYNSLSSLTCSVQTYD